MLTSLLQVELITKDTSWDEAFTEATVKRGASKEESEDSAPIQKIMFDPVHSKARDVDR